MTDNRGGAETRSELLHKNLTDQIIGAAIEVHRCLGPGLLESAYESCFCHELRLRQLSFLRQVELPVEYKGVQLDCGYRIDVLVADSIVVELKCVEKVLPVHEAQLLTYLHLSRKDVGLLLNFHTAVLTKGGVVRRALSRPRALSASASPRLK
ncbi:MAG: GxxExxY protein [Candidatus Korobacteraceae bacterium]